MLFPWLRKHTDPEAVGREHWSTSFRWLDRRRFEEQDTADYRAGVDRGRLELLLKRDHLFAWTTNAVSRFDDFVLEAGASFDPDNGHSALGFVLRYIDESNFYYFLLSNRGFFRFDLVFNGNPTPLIGWVANPLIRPAGNPVRVIARGPHFSFYLDDEWIGEVEDETIRTGRFGFAGQNYGERPQARFLLDRFSLDSRPIEVERAYTRWVEVVPASPQHRLALARAFAGREQYAAAVVQLRRSLRGSRNAHGSPDELFLLAECLMRLRLNAQALEAVEKTLQAAPDHPQALQEKANLLYLLGRLPEAAEHLGRILPRFDGSSPLWNLAGNVHHALGRFEEAEAAYRRAIALEPDVPQYRVNAARTLATRGREAEALELFREAARQLFRQEAYDDLAMVLPWIRRLFPRDAESRALEAKVHYHEGRTREAHALLRGLVAEGCDDSAVSYLNAMLLIEGGARREALDSLRRAVELEPTSGLYRFRLAETLHLLGEDCGEELARARSLAPEDPWVNNLDGQLLLAAGAIEEAVTAFERARAGAPDEALIEANLAEALSRAGRVQEARGVLREAIARHPEDPRLLNQRGCLSVLARDFASALQDYDKALAADPVNVEIAKNLAAVCIETDMILRAEELLGWLTEQSPTPDVYNLVAHVALVQGELGRAEAALKAGLEIAPRDPDLRANMARLRLDRGDVGQGRQMIEELLRDEPRNERALRERERIRERWEVELRCAGCGRSWWAPKEVPPQPALRLRGEPPADCPAGRCAACGSVYCVGCVSQTVVDGRLRCGGCGGALRLDDERLRFLVRRFVEPEGGSA